MNHSKEFIEKKKSLTDLKNKYYNLKLDGFDYKEIAEIVDKDLKAIDNAIQRIRNKIKKIMKNKENLKNSKKIKKNVKKMSNFKKSMIYLLWL